MNRVAGMAAWLIALVICVVLGLAFGDWLSQFDFVKEHSLLSDAAVNLPTAILVGLMLLYYQIDSVFFWVNRWALYWKLIRVEFSAEYKLDQLCDLSKVEATFNERFPSNKRKGWENGDKLLLNIPNGVIQVSQRIAYEAVEYQDNPDIILRLESTEIEIPYRTWNKNAPSIAGFFGDLEDMLRSQNPKYGCRVIFAKFNPYYGLFLRKIRTPEIASFEVSFTEQIGNILDHVQIGKSKVSITTGRADHWQSLSSKYVALTHPSEFNFSTE